MGMDILEGSRWVGPCNPQSASRDDHDAAHAGRRTAHQAAAAGQVAAQRVAVGQPRWPGVDGQVAQPPGTLRVRTCIIKPRQQATCYRGQRGG